MVAADECRSINNSTQKDNYGLLGWKISDAKEQFFPFPDGTTDTTKSAIYLEKPPGKDNSDYSYSPATISIVVITGMLYLAVMIYLVSRFLVCLMS